MNPNLNPDDMIEEVIEIPVASGTTDSGRPGGSDGPGGSSGRDIPRDRPTLGRVLANLFRMIMDGAIRLYQVFLRLLESFRRSPRPAGSVV